MKAVCIHVALCGLITAVVSGCDQPKPNCLTAQAPFAVKLTPVPGGRSPGCTETDGLASFYENPQVGVAPYYAKDKKGQPDYGKASFAIKTAEIGTLVAHAEEAEVTPTTRDVFSFGPVVTNEPDGNDLCRVPTLSETRVVIPEVAADEANEITAQPAVNATLKWSDLDVYVTPASLGTQIRARLSDTRVTPTGTCTIEYTAMGLAPAVPCYKTDEDDNPLKNPDGTFQLDPTLCDPEPHPELGRFGGSGIDSSVNFECSPVVGYCVLAGEQFPALK